MVRRSGWLAVAVCALTTGCPNVNTYGTARTTPAGEINHTISAEGYGFKSELETTDAAGNKSTEDVSFFLPLPPSYHLRLGVAEQIDLGFHVNNLSSLGVDAKFNFLRGRTLDLAIDPGVQWYSYSVSSGDQEESINVFYLHGPLLIDVNLSELLSLVFTPGVAYAIVSQDLVSTDESDAARSADGLFARFGIGLNIRVTKRFAIHPELTAIRGFQDDEALIYMAGVGFSFGSLPNFDDVEGGQPAE